MKKLRIVIAFIVMSIPVFAQRTVFWKDSTFTEEYFSNKRFFFRGSPNLHNYHNTNLNGDFSYVKGRWVLGVNLEIGMDFPLGKQQFISAAFGHGVFQHSFNFEVQNLNINGWGNTYGNITSFNFVNFWTLGSEYSKYWTFSNRSMFSISAGLMFRLFLHNLNRGVDLPMRVHLQNEDGQFFGISEGNFDARLTSPVSVNPTLQAKYSLVNKKETTIGIGLITAIPLFNVITGTMTVFPEYPEKASYDFNYRGGFIGLSLTISNIPKPPGKNVRVNFGG